MTFNDVRAKAWNAAHNYFNQNDIDTNDMCVFIQELEKRIRERLSLSFEGYLSEWKEDEYSGELLGDYVMTAPDGYADLYVYYAIAKSFLKLGEYERYNNYILLHNDVYETFMKEYAQRHMPKPVYFKY